MRSVLPSFSEEEWADLDTNVASPHALEQIAVAPMTVRQRATLVLLTGLNAGQVFALDKDVVTIGRGRKADIRLEDTGISREHARIVRTDGGTFKVTDNGSRNGTYVNAKRTDGAELYPGDRIHLGPTLVLRFSIVDETEERLARQLYEASTRDALTRIYNRRYFNERLVAEVAFAQRHEAKVGLILFDIDHFKTINDRFGHAAGDDVLRAVAACISRLTRAEDVVARYGGEEFVVLTRSIPPAHLLILGERMRAGVEGLEVPVGGGTVHVTISAGIASLAECGPHATGDVLLLLADERLYRAKSQGRNCVAFE